MSSKLEQTFETRLLQVGNGLPMPTRQYSFTLKPIPIKRLRAMGWKRWRFDFCYVEQRLAIELEGGVYSRGRHVRPTGFIGDCDKYNAAVLMGYRVLRFTIAHLDRDPIGVMETIRKALRNSEIAL